MRASKRSRNAHLVANRADKPLILVPTIPDDLKTDISSAVRAFTMVQVGGTCMTRALVGNSLLRECGLDAHDSPHFQMAPNMCAKRGWAASIWANRLMSGCRRKSVMFGMSS